MKGEKFTTVIGAPQVLNSRAKSNQSSNKKKADRIKFATEHEKNKKRKREADGDDAGDEEDVGAKESLPSSKRKKVTVPAPYT